MILSVLDVFKFEILQDNNGVIGLLEPMKTSLSPQRVPIDDPIVKIVSGEREREPS